jgi:hypothetical protein
MSGPPFIQAMTNQELDAMEIGDKRPMPHSSEWEGANKALYALVGEYCRGNGKQFQVARPEDPYGKPCGGLYLERIR